MKSDGSRLKIALQHRGRLAKPSMQLLKSIGLDFSFHQDQLFSPCRNFPLDILFLRDDDIPEYVQDQITDLGIVGLNVVQEKSARVSRLDFLGFGVCKLLVAVPRKGSLQTLSDLQDKRIATSHPRILSCFLEQRGIQARIIEISGSVEITPSLEVADAICDLVSTGSTLRMNDLEAIEVVLRSEACLIAHTGSLEDREKREYIERFRFRCQGTIRARGAKYVIMNAPAASLDEISRILPGMKSPTVVPLAEKGMIAIHSAVPEELFWEVTEKLKQAGASDILVVPVEKLVV